jgi:transcriptional regulator with XRE-family HTH domain
MSRYTKDVKSIRKSLNMTQAELAELLGIDRSSLAHMENGRRVPRYIALLLASIVDGRRDRKGRDNEAAA